MMDLDPRLLNPEQEQAQRETERELLSSEAAFMVAALLVLRRSSKRKPRTRFELELARRELVEALATTVYDGRQRSRLRSFVSVRRELDPFRDDLRFADLSFAEHRRASQIARRFGDYWQRAATQAIEEGETMAAAARIAARRQRSRMQMTAITENARAFNEERARQAREVPTTTWLTPFKYWNATLDKRTCSVCTAADGEMVRADEPFTNGTPGLVHPRCRCIQHMILLPASAQGRMAS